MAGLPLFEATDTAKRLASRVLEASPSGRVIRGGDLLHRRAVVYPTGIPVLDRCLEGGFPVGSLVELTGPLSSGKTSLVWCVAAETARGGGLVAYVDPYDTLDAESAVAAGMVLDRLLWIRWAESAEADETKPLEAEDLERSVEPVERALKSADVAARSGVFRLVVLDLQPLPGQHPRQWSPSVWFRLQRAVQGTETTLLLLSPVRMAGGAAKLTLLLERRQSWWREGVSRRSPLHFEPEENGFEEGVATGGNRLQGWEAQARFWKGHRSNVVSIHCRF
ncbi:MAG TPA: hypothetical protein P5568_00055 [Acidobacteriota bacterium]|nr:hypothetical protein [Acidobacteriota bacterium]HRR55329.1 hypothetical protein [Acidobacteriota bacterium]HRV06834.1 hypothetical protein [Acidobacteriota bacterium]